MYQIHSSTVDNLENIKKLVVGKRSGVINNLWSGKVCETSNAWVGVATGGEYTRLDEFKNFKGDEGLKFAGSGKGWSREQAEISAIGEFFERYSSGFINKPIYQLTCTEAGFEMPDFFTNNQYKQEDFSFKKIDENTKLSFVQVEDVDSNQKFIPAIFNYFPFVGNNADNHLIHTSTNGIAAHSNPENAKISAILEILERDLLTNAWLSGASFALSEIPKDSRWDKFFNYFAGEVHCIFPENEFNIPFCVLSLVYPKVNGKSIIVSGSACGFSKTEAFSSALLEAFQGKKYLETTAEKQFKKFNEVISFTDHCQFYTARNEVFKKIPLYDRSNIVGFNDEAIETENKLDYLIDIFKKHNLKLYFSDLTTIDAQTVGISIFRVFSPDLSMLYGDERFRYLGQKRIWNKDIFKNYTKINHYPNYNKLPHFLG